MSYLVVAGEPTAKSRKEKLASTDINRFHVTSWYSFNSLSAANVYAADMLRLHPTWTVAVVNPAKGLGPHPSGE